MSNALIVPNLGQKLCMERIFAFNTVQNIHLAITKITEIAYHAMKIVINVMDQIIMNVMPVHLEKRRIERVVKTVLNIVLMTAL